MVCIVNLNIIGVATSLLITSSSVVYGMKLDPDEEDCKRTKQPISLRIDISLIKKDPRFDILPVMIDNQENRQNKNPQNEKLAISKGRGRGRGSNLGS